MPSFRPAVFPRRPRRSTILSEAVYRCQLWYYRYEVTTPLYVMSPGEKTAFNLILLALLGLLVSATYYYLPRTMQLSMQRLEYYFTGVGSQKLQVAGIEFAKGVVHGTNVAIASLAPSGRTGMNASMALTP